MCCLWRAVKAPLAATVALSWSFWSLRPPPYAMPWCLVNINMGGNPERLEQVLGLYSALLVNRLPACQSLHLNLSRSVSISLCLQGSYPAHLTVLVLWPCRTALGPRTTVCLYTAPCTHSHLSQTESPDLGSGLYGPGLPLLLVSWPDSLETGLRCCQLFKSATKILHPLVSSLESGFQHIFCKLHSSACSLQHCPFFPPVTGARGPLLPHVTTWGICLHDISAFSLSYEVVASLNASVDKQSVLCWRSCCHIPPRPGNVESH